MYKHTTQIKSTQPPKQINNIYENRGKAKPLTVKLMFTT